MTKDLLTELHKDLIPDGPERNQYTRRAFQMLPKLEHPRILDVGCGTGGPTLELARLSNGQVIGLDISQADLDRLEQKIRKHDLTQRVQAVAGSMSGLDFPDEYFDIIWSEGSIYVLGFERGLKQWRQFIKPGGFLVVHEMTWLRPNPPQEILDHWQKLYAGISTIPDLLGKIPTCGYRVVGHFALPEDAWWILYYGPLQARIEKLRRQYADDPHARAVLDNEQREVDMFKKYQSWYGSAFFVLQKVDQQTPATNFSSGED